MKNIIVVTGGAGFIGSNLIELLIKKTKHKIISIDNYSTGSVRNHLINRKVKDIEGEAKRIEKILDRVKNNIKTIFHFGEFSRIYQSFKLIDKCYYSNMIGTYEIIKFCS